MGVWLINGGIYQPQYVEAMEIFNSMELQRKRLPSIEPLEEDFNNSIGGKRVGFKVLYCVSASRLSIARL